MGIMIYILFIVWCMGKQRSWEDCIQYYDKLQGLHWLYLFHLCLHCCNTGAQSYPLETSMATHFAKAHWKYLHLLHSVSLPIYWSPIHNCHAHHESPERKSKKIIKLSNPIQKTIWHVMQWKRSNFNLIQRQYSRLHSENNQILAQFKWQYGRLK